MNLTLIQKYFLSKNNEKDEQKFKVKLKPGKWKHFKMKINFSTKSSHTRFEIIANQVLATGQRIHVKRLRFKNCSNLHLN